MVYPKFSPLKKRESYLLEDDNYFDAISSEMPSGYDYLTNKAEDGFLKLVYLDLYDYLPKEKLESFKEELKLFIAKNKLSPFGPFYSNDDNNRIDNIGRYIDRRAFSKIATINFCKNEYLKQYAANVTISLRNLSPSFLIVKYRFHINDGFKDRVNTICKTRYTSYSEISRRINVPWYKPKRFGRAMYIGDNARTKALYALISELKWIAYTELKRYFTIQFEQDQLFPPSFETYSTNIRPNSDSNSIGFWHSIMSGHCTDYAPKYNACVNFENENSQYEGTSCSAYCGGNYSYIDNTPEIAQYQMADNYEVYLVANSIIRIAERDMALCNKWISKAINKGKTLPILKTRVCVEQKLYYSYRFISEFTGNTIFQEDAKAFRSRMYKNGSSTERCLKSIPENTEEVKNQIDALLNLLNDAAEYGSMKLNMNLQIFMMVVTVLSLIVAFVAMLGINIADLKLLWDTICECFSQLWDTICGYFSQG